MKIKIRKADQLFSEYIRRRDKWTCQRCLRRFDGNKSGLHCSHFWSRRNWNTRFDPSNADALCFGCHQRWESEKQGAYRDFKLKQLGEKGYKQLEQRAVMIAKKDWKLAEMYVRQLLQTI